MKYYLVILLSLTLWTTNTASANWTANVGYHNPSGSLIGINFMYLNQDFATELGIGWLQVSSEKNGSSDQEEEESLFLGLSGDLNMKYFLTSGSIRPYGQVGFAMNFSGQLGEQNEASGNVDGAFVGAGILAGKPSFYAYTSINTRNVENYFYQFGVGTDI